MLCSLYSNYKYSFFFFFLRGKRSLLSPHCFALSVCRENKGFVSWLWTQPDGSTHMFPSKVGFLPLASCSETHACAGENLFHLISGVSISDACYFSQGLCLCDSTFWVAGEQWPVVAVWGCCSCDLGRAAGLGVVFRVVVTDERWLRAARSPALPRNKGMRLPADKSERPFARSVGAVLASFSSSRQPRWITQLTDVPFIIFTAILDTHCFSM